MWASSSVGDHPREREVSDLHPLKSIWKLVFFSSHLLSYRILCYVHVSFTCIKDFLCYSVTRVTGLKIEELGETSIASTISYLDNSFVYVGSSYGDSQVYVFLFSDSGF